MNGLFKMLLFYWLSMFLLVDNLKAQSSWEEVVEQLASQGEEGSYNLETLFEELEDWKAHPVNINTATKEQLEKFPFLSPQLVENMLYYLYKYGPMLSEKELLMVEDMDRRTVRYLLPFITFGNAEKQSVTPTFQQVLKYGKQELVTRFDIPFYTKKGYNTHYLGYGFYHNIRYSFRYADKVYAGITAEKDAGEPFFEGKNQKGYDYYSPYLFIRNIGRIKALAVGNYRLGYGYGLVMNTGFGMGKTATLATLENASKGIRKHSSTDEYHYFQGVALSYRLSDRWTADVFHSYRKMGGTVDNRFITSLKEDGYYRTESDFKKRNTFSNQLTGSYIHYNGKQYELGLTAVYHVFNKVLNPPLRSYNIYYPRGRDFFNTGIHYKFFWKRFAFWGETAVDKEGKIATLNALRYSPKVHTRFLVMNRFYDAAYQSLYARSVSEGSNVQNESGLYIGLETNFLRYFKINASADWFYFPWKRYLVSRAGTSGFDGLLQISYSPVYELDMFIRYRYKTKYKDHTDKYDVKSAIPYIQQKARYQLVYSHAGGWMLKTTVDYVHARYSGCNASQGILVAQSAGYPFRRLPLRVDGSIAWFHTDDYNSRISLYEKSLLHMFSIPSFYGRGMRFSLLARYECSEHLMFQAKYGITHYRDRKTIGTSWEQIDGNVKSDLYLQVRVKF